ncbi:hypothetical protein Q1695_003351 [Nippostrongylus brasiliensis]|nr:hypothetical protein Q1695_003351 [Nippostrongylus brasiliensis]
MCDAIMAISSRRKGAASFSYSAERSTRDSVCLRAECGVGGAWRGMAFAWRPRFETSSTHYSICPAPAGSAAPGFLLLFLYCGVMRDIDGS